MALTQTENHEGFFPIVQKEFFNAGVVLVVLPNLKNSGINGATKKVDGKILLMVNDRRHYADTFWFTLMHEVGHILNGDYGVTRENIQSNSEDAADRYAVEKLIPQKKYEIFLSNNSKIDEIAIRRFALDIGRDPGIVLGRLLMDGKIAYTNTALIEKIRRKYSAMKDFNMH